MSDLASEGGIPVPCLFTHKSKGKKMKKNNITMTHAVKSCDGEKLYI